MTTRTARKRVTFAHPFTLEGVDGVHAPGTYDVDTDEETIDGLSFVAWRRAATLIHLPAGGGMEVHSVDPMDLEASLFTDAAAPPTLIA